ncbi:ABC transporter substrate-binding protein [Candidatus Poribacteria bacterium]|nr:ABC transporter substrate-binding protein [Candidatus Poribacteria bacterium]
MNIRNTTFFLSILLIIGLIAGLSSCGRMGELIPDSSDPNDITIGVITSLTGRDAAPYGLPMKRGFMLARDEINAMTNLNIKFILEDDKSTEDGAIKAVQNLVERNVSAIVGIAVSDYLEDAFPIAQENGIVAFSSVSSAAGLSSIGDYIFRAGLATNNMIPSGIMITHEKLGYTKVATIYDSDDTYSISSNEEVVKALTANGIEILTQETFSTGDTDFAMQLSNIMDMQPDALFISSLAGEMTQVIIQAGALGITDTTQLIVPDLTNAEVQAAGNAAEGTIAFASWFSESDAPGNQAFVQNYMAEFGIEVEPWAAQSYAALYILANAISNATDNSSSAIRDALAQTKDYPTVLGNFSFDPNGEALYNPVVLIVKDGVLQVPDVGIDSHPQVPEMPDEGTTDETEMTDEGTTEHIQ